MTYRSANLDTVDARALAAAVAASRLRSHHVRGLAAEELRLLEQVTRDPARYRSLRGFLSRLR